MRGEQCARATVIAQRKKRRDRKRDREGEERSRSRIDEKLKKKEKLKTEDNNQQGRSLRKHNELVGFTRHSIPQRAGFMQ